MPWWVRESGQNMSCLFVWQSRNQAVTQTSNTQHPTLNSTPNEVPTGQFGVRSWMFDVSAKEFSRSLILRFARQLACETRSH